MIQNKQKAIEAQIDAERESMTRALSNDGAGYYALRGSSDSTHYMKKSTLKALENNF